MVFSKGHNDFQRVLWYLSTFPLCSGVYGGFLMCLICSLLRNAVNQGPNSLQQSVRIAVIRNGTMRILLYTNSMLDRTHSSVCICDLTNRLQSSSISYCTSGLLFQKGKHVSICTSCPGVAQT